MDKVSIIIPIYNAEKYLKECVESVINQDYHNLEIIMIDDGSTDGSKNACKHYAEIDSRIQLIEKANSGVSDTRNIGLKKATGDYIAFVDSDDTISEFFISEMIESLKKNSADIAFCEVRVSEGNQLLNIYNTDCVISNLEAMVDLFTIPAYGTMICNKVFKREVVLDENNEIFDFDKSIKCGEDELWIIKALINSQKVCCLKKKLYNWRIRNDSASHSEKLTDIQFSDIQAQEMAMQMLLPICKQASLNALSRLQDKLFNCFVLAYIQKEHSFDDVLENFKRKYRGFYYKGEKGGPKKIIKQSAIYGLICLNISPTIIKKFYYHKFL